MYRNQRLLPVLALTILTVSCNRGPAPTSTPIPSSGGAALEIPVPDQAVFFLQNDERWGSDEIGGSGEPLAAVGCTISAVATAACCLDHPTTPGELNAKLKTKRGFTNQGWLIWKKVRSATGDKIDVVVPPGISHSELDAALQAGDIPVVKFYLRGGVSHWVAVVGKSGEEYLVMDPLDKTKTYTPLSALCTRVHSVRYVKRR